jgi:hypothetical protein
MTYPGRKYRVLVSDRHLPGAQDRLPLRLIPVDSLAPFVCFAVPLSDLSDRNLPVQVLDIRGAQPFNRVCGELHWMLQIIGSHREEVLGSHFGIFNLPCDHHVRYAKVGDPF